MFMTVIKCLLLNNDILNANMTLLKISLSWQLDNFKIKLNCHVVGFDVGCHEAIMTVSW